MPTIIFTSDRSYWQEIAKTHWSYDIHKAVHVRAGKQAFRTRIEREKNKLKK